MAVRGAERRIDIKPTATFVPPRSIDSIPIQEPSPTPELTKYSTLVLNALADEKKDWDFRRLGEALGISENAARYNVSHLMSLGLVKKSMYRLTPEGRATDKGAFQPQQLKIVEALSKGGMTLGELRTEVKMDDAVILDIVSSLNSRDLVARVPFQTSLRGREVLRGVGGFEEIYEFRVKLLLRIAGGDRTMGQLMSSMHCGNDHIGDALESLESSRYISKLIQPGVGRQSPLTYYGITNEGRAFLSRYLTGLDPEEQVAPSQVRKAKIGEVKVRLLELIATSPNIPDVRWLYGELPFDYPVVVRALKDCMAQGLIGKDRIRVVPGESLDIERLSEKEKNRKVAAIAVEAFGILRKWHWSAQQLAKRLGVDEEVMWNAVGVLRDMNIVTVERFFLCGPGEALLQSSKELLSRPLLRSEAQPRLRILTPDNVTRLQEISKDLGTPKMDELNKTQQKLARWAKILLLASEGKTYSEISSIVGITTVHHTIETFNEHGMSIFSPSLNQRKPPKPKVKAREINSTEARLIENLSNMFTTDLKGKVPFSEFLKIRSARIVKLSYLGALASEIAKQTGVNNTSTVYAAIHLFNNVGIDMFSHGFGLRKPRKPLRELTPDEVHKLNEMAGHFSAFNAPVGKQHGGLEFSRSRRAKVLLLAAQKIPSQEIAGMVGFKSYISVREMITGFNKEGMASFKDKRIAKPKKPVRALTPDELTQIQDMAARFDIVSKTGGNRADMEFRRLRRAKIILLSSQHTLSLQ